MRVAIVLLALFVSSTAYADEPAPPPQPLTNPKAIELQKAGGAAFNTGDFAEASKRFAAAYEIEAHPDLLWSWAQAERFAYHCTTAIGLYKKYAREAQTPSKVDAANKAIKLCEQDRRRPQERPPGEGPERTPVPWYQNKLGTTFAATGIVGLTVGVTYLALASGSRSAADQEMYLDDFEDKLGEATFRRRVGAVSLSVGAAALAAGVTIYVLHDRKQRALTASTDGRVVFVGARF